LNESTCLAANSAIAQMAAIAILRATALTPALTAVGYAVPTLAQERTEVLFLATEATTTTTALFIA
jgi:hypothetical protein